MMSETKWKEQFAEKLNICIKTNGGMTIPQIAKHVGVNRATIYRWLNGESIPSSYHIYKLSKLFHVHTGYFDC